MVRWDAIAYLQNFFQLNFLFSGLEVSSIWVFAARLSTFLVFTVCAVWIVIRIGTKLLDCVQTLLTSLASLPKTLYLLLFLVIPLSQDSLGSKWIGYILLSLTALGVGILAVLVLVLWKYGVEQAVRFVNTLRSNRSEARHKDPEIPLSAQETVLRPVLNAPAAVRTETTL
jgi:hypothetical protein